MKIKRFDDPCFSVELSEVNNEDLINGCFKIPQTVTVISKNAFSKCDELEKVFIGPNVVYIAENAFENCNNLTFLMLSEKIESFAENAFSNCDNLKFITVSTEDGELDVDKEYLGVFLAFRKEQKYNNTKIK